MLDIKKYSNGRFFDAVNRKYINADCIKELIKKGEKIKVTLTTTGEEITDAVLSQYAEKRGGGETDSKTEASEEQVSTMADSRKIDRFLNTESMKTWVSALIDRRINQVLEIINLPTRDQISELSASINDINQKIDALSVKKGDGEKPSDYTLSAFELKVSDSKTVSDTESEALSYSAVQSTAVQLTAVQQKKNPFEEYAEQKGIQNKIVEKKSVKRRLKKRG